MEGIAYVMQHCDMTGAQLGHGLLIIYSPLEFTTGIRNFLGISYLDNFHKTCHFQEAWTPTILFSAILVFR